MTAALRADRVTMQELVDALVPIAGEDAWDWFMAICWMVTIATALAVILKLRAQQIRDLRRRSPAFYTPPRADPRGLRENTQGAHLPLPSVRPVRDAVRDGGMASHTAASLAAAAAAASALERTRRNGAALSSATSARLQQSGHAFSAHTAQSLCAAAAAASALAKPKVGHRGKQDLKRIRGVGVLVEDALNAEGILRYEQIAGWSPQEVEHMMRALGLGRRIIKERWVDQARALAGSGATSFSLKYDRGEAV